MRIRGFAHRESDRASVIIIALVHAEPLGDPGTQRHCGRNRCDPPATEREDLTHRFRGASRGTGWPRNVLADPGASRGA